MESKKITDMFGNNKWIIPCPPGSNIVSSSSWLYHREDGPAFEGANGELQWYLEGVQYSELEYKKIMRKKKIETLKLDIDDTKNLP